METTEVTGLVPINPRITRIFKGFSLPLIPPRTNEFKVYGTETSLHGLKYVFQTERHSCEKFFWSVSFIAGIIMAVFLIYGVCASYLKNPVVVTYQVEETRISNIPFPAVTLCNTNRVRKSVATRVIKSAEGIALKLSNSKSINETELTEINAELREVLKKVKCIDYICQVPKMLGTPENFEDLNSVYETFRTEMFNTRGMNISLDVNIDAHDLYSFREEAQHPCDEFAVFCAWGEKEYNCSEFFTPLYTDEGTCCTFNRIPADGVEVDLDNMYENAAKESQVGTDFWHLESLLAKTPEDESIRELLKNIKQIWTQKRGGRSEGLSVVLNPQLDEYFCSSYTGTGFVFKTHHPVDKPKMLKHSSLIPLKTEVSGSITPSSIFADRDIKLFNIDNRRCYFHGEYKLNLFETYTKENCLMECETYIVQETCGCLADTYGIPTEESCGPEKHSCVAAAYKKLMSKPVGGHCAYCLPTCNELSYIESIVMSPMGENNMKYHTGFPREYYRNWMDKNMSILHVYFEDDSFYARERKQLNNLTDLIANIGGILGLCLGFSGLSLVELGYFFLVRPCFKKRRTVVTKTDTKLKVPDGCVAAKKTCRRNSCS